MTENTNQVQSGITPEPNPTVATPVTAGNIAVAPTVAPVAVATAPAVSIPVATTPAPAPAPVATTVAQTAPVPVPNPEKERLNQAIQENQRDKKQELTEIVRYPGLKLITGWAKLTGIVLGIVFVILAIIALMLGIFTRDTTFFEGFINFVLLFCIGLFIFSICYAAGDLVQLMIDNEENTRKIAKGTEKA